MADAKPPTPPEPNAATASTPAPNASSQAKPSTAYKVPERNPALRMLGLPNLPRKLPSRNWTIFLTLTTALSAAIIYDKREKKRATAKWARAVAPLAEETISNPSQLPRKLTIMLSAPPGEGVRISQDHFIEYVKPILAASGLDWDFIQGRMQGDVRAAVAERIRRRRRLAEKPEEELEPTEDNVREAVRRKNQVPEYEGEPGDLVIGRNTWKEYIRGLHEGWLGPLDPPVYAQTPAPVPTPTTTDADAISGEGVGQENKEGEDASKSEEEKPKEEEKKPERPPQPLPYNTPEDYAAAHLPNTLPQTLAPSTAVQFPHILGFSNTITRFSWFLNRRALADDIGREVAAVCFAAHREWQETRDAAGDASPTDTQAQLEQDKVLKREEKNWLKSVFKDDDEEKKDGQPPKEKVWANQMVLDERIATRMRRFEIRREDEERARAIVIPEEEVEGWIKGSFRSVFRWGAETWRGKPKGPNVGNIDDVEV